MFTGSIALSHLWQCHIWRAQGVAVPGYCTLLLFVLALCQEPGAVQHKPKSNSLLQTGYRVIAKVTIPDLDSLV